MHDDNAIAHAQYFWHLGRDQNDAQTVGLKLVNQLIDLFLRPHVYAAGWLVEDQHFRARHQPASNCHFLLIPAGQQANRLLHRRRFNIKETDKIADRLLLVFMLQAAAAVAEIAQRGQGHVLFYRHAQH